MLSFPLNLSPENFLKEFWQKRPLFMPGALTRVQPAITRNELAWLATLDDVESRIVFVERGAQHTRYRTETGPFDDAFLRDLPKRDWTLLVHDVEKHIPAMRALFAQVPFVPDWRIDDLMVSFAAPGGGVGPHQDHYDVFLCQGIGARDWHVSTDALEADPAASDDLALLREFSGEKYPSVSGDVLYLPPGVAHWGIATRATITYSIGMRAPQASDLAKGAFTSPDCFYADPDLNIDEAAAGYIHPAAIRRAISLPGATGHDDVAAALGRYVTQTKNWLTPDSMKLSDARALLSEYRGRLDVHGMSRLAFDDARIYANGIDAQLDRDLVGPVARLCSKRILTIAERRHVEASAQGVELLAWLSSIGIFEIPDI